MYGRESTTADSEGLIGASSRTAGGASRALGVAAWVLLGVTFFLAVAAFVGACMLWSQWSAIKDLENGCSENAVDKYSLIERSPDAIAADWKIQGRDLYSSSHNGHLPNLGTNIRRAVGFCPGGVNSISATSAGVGITVTPTISEELNMIFFADHGLASDHTGVTLYGVSLTSCVTVWSATLQALTSQTLATSDNDSAGIDNPLANIYSSLQIVKNETNDYVLVFGDMGTGAYYNLSACATAACGSRIFVLDPTTGELLKRERIVEFSSAVAGYKYQSDQIRMSPMVYRGQAYFGTTSNQSFDVVTTGTIDFYSLIGSVDINSGWITMIEPVIDALSFGALGAGNLGAMVSGTPPVDINSDLLIYGSAYLLNQSQTVSECLQSGLTRKDCLTQGINSNQLFAHSIYDTTIDAHARAQWRYSPYGIDAWNGGCITGTGSPCPPESGPTAAYATGSIIVQNQCGQRFVISMGQSGTLYSVEVETGIKKWTTYIGPSSNETATYGLSFDGNNVWFALGNLQKKSYLTLSGTKRCDSMWVKVNAWNGVIEQIIPVPCSRASADCPAIVPDPYLAGIFPASVLDFSNRGTEKNGSAVACPSTAPDLRVGAFGATAVGSVITTNNLMFAGSFSGHMHVYDHSGSYITSLAQCDSGIVFGGASIAKISYGRTILSWGCGYGTDQYLQTFGDSELRVMLVA